jgi:hypothetical protein
MVPSLLQLPVHTLPNTNGGSRLCIKKNNDKIRLSMDDTTLWFFGSYAVGTVIGKALADFDGQDGVIEVVVGRL